MLSISVGFTGGTVRFSSDLRQSPLIRTRIKAAKVRQISVEGLEAVKVALLERATKIVLHFLVQELSSVSAASR